MDFKIFSSVYNYIYPRDEAIQNAKKILRESSDDFIKLDCGIVDDKEKFDKFKNIGEKLEQSWILLEKYHIDDLEQEWQQIHEKYMKNTPKIIYNSLVKCDVPDCPIADMKKILHFAYNQNDNITQK